MTTERYLIESRDRQTGDWSHDGVCTLALEDCWFDDPAAAEAALLDMQGWQGWGEADYRIVAIEIDRDPALEPSYLWRVDRVVEEFPGPVTVEDDR